MAHRCARATAPLPVKRRYWSSRLPKTLSCLFSILPDTSHPIHCSSLSCVPPPRWQNQSCCPLLLDGTDLNDVGHINGGTSWILRKLEPASPRRAKKLRCGYFIRICSEHGMKKMHARWPTLWPRMATLSGSTEVRSMDDNRLSLYLERYLRTIRQPRTSRS